MHFYLSFGMLSVQPQSSPKSTIQIIVHIQTDKQTKIQKWKEKVNKMVVQDLWVWILP